MTNIAASVHTVDILREITNERVRQQAKEGWSLEHDDQLVHGEMADAAAAYAGWAAMADNWRKDQGMERAHLDRYWPKQWHRRLWKPKTRRHDLIRAAALIVAEIERLDRASKVVERIV